MVFVSVIFTPATNSYSHCLVDGVDCQTASLYTYFHLLANPVNSALTFWTLFLRYEMVFVSVIFTPGTNSCSHCLVDGVNCQTASLYTYFHS